MQQFNFKFFFFFTVIAPKFAEALTNALKIEMIDFGPFIYFGKVRTLYNWDIWMQSREQKIFPTWICWLLLGGDYSGGEGTRSFLGQQIIYLFVWTDLKYIFFTYSVKVYALLGKIKGPSKFAPSLFHCIFSTRLTKQNK